MPPKAKASTSAAENEPAAKKSKTSSACFSLVATKQPFCKKGTADGEVQKPRYAAVLADGTLLVTSILGIAGFIKVFSSASGAFLHQVPLGDMQMPISVASDVGTHLRNGITEGGCIYVSLAKCKERRFAVAKAHLRGSALECLSMHRDAFLQTEDMTVSASHLFVADRDRCQVLMFDKDDLSAAVRRIGFQRKNPLDKEPGGLWSPWGVALHGDELFVSDMSGTKCISVYSQADGSFRRAFGAASNAAGLSFVGDFLLVAEYSGKQIQILGVDGEQLRVVPMPNARGLKGIAADPERDRVFVTDFLKQQVDVLTLEDA